MTSDEYQHILDRCLGRQESLPQRVRWRLQQEWREVYAITLHEATGKWQHGKYDWQLFSFGFARALNGERAVQAYSSQRPESIIVCPEEDRLPAVRLIGGTLPEFRRKGEDVSVWPDDLSWVMAFTHEEESGLGPYFSRREWVVSSPFPGHPETEAPDGRGQASGASVPRWKDQMSRALFTWPVRGRSEATPMSRKTEPRWESIRTDDSRYVEDFLRKEFPGTDACRYNSASIRVRVIDPRFEGMEPERRDAMVEPLLKRLPEEIQADIMNLITLSPSETKELSRRSLVNLEFEDPSPSML